jgi:DNA-binding NarL/FixJ family response regulator
VQNELIELRAHGVAIVALVDKMAGGQRLPDPHQWRIGGNLQAPLNPAGTREINRRFAAGEDNRKIAEEMTISPEGVRQRRQTWAALRGPIRRRVRVTSTSNP